MDEIKNMEGINGETVVEVYETVSTNNNMLLKIGIGAAVAGAVGYGVYRLGKWFKNRKNKTVEVEEFEEIVVEKPSKK